jgi:hypothetical protein
MAKSVRIPNPMKLGRNVYSGAKRVAGAAVPSWFKGVIVTATIFLVLAAVVAAWKPANGLVMPVVRAESEMREGFIDGGCGAAGACSLMH